LVDYLLALPRSIGPRVSNATIAQIKFNSARRAFLRAGLARAGGRAKQSIRHLDCSSARPPRGRRHYLMTRMFYTPLRASATDRLRATPRVSRRRLSDEISTAAIDFLIDILLSRARVAAIYRHPSPIV